MRRQRSNSVEDAPNGKSGIILAVVAYCGVACSGVGDGGELVAAVVGVACWTGRTCWFGVDDFFASISDKCAMSRRDPKFSAT